MIAVNMRIAMHMFPTKKETLKPHTQSIRVVIVGQLAAASQVIGFLVPLKEVISGCPRSLLYKTVVFDKVFCVIVHEHREWCFFFDSCV